MIEFKPNQPTIAEIYRYTYSNPKTRTRFEYMKRDIIKTKVKIERRTVYKRSKENKLLTPEERLFVRSFSHPNYSPFSYLKSRGAKKQRKITHQYDIVLCIGKTEEGIYSYWNSPIVWRIGSQKKYPKTVPQNKVKTIFRSTREKLERKYRNLPKKQKDEAIKKEIKKIKERSPYEDVGDYCSRELGIMLDAYFRDFYIMKKFSCLYGKLWYDKPNPDVLMPFFDKHCLFLVGWLMMKGILKYK